MGKVNEELRESRLKALGLRGALPDMLTETVLEAVRTHPTGERYQLADGDVPGLVLAISGDGKASFLLHYRTKDGSQRTLKVASAGAMPLKAVRKLARTKLEEVGRGGDPAEEKREARAESARAEEQERTGTVRAYLDQVYGPKVLAHLKDGGASKPSTRFPGRDMKPSGTWGRILSGWEPLLEVQLSALTRDAIEKVLSDRKARGKAMGTLLRDWSAFRALLADAVDRGQLAAVPMAKRPMPIRKEKGNQRVRWLGQFDREDVAEGQDERSRFNEALKAFDGAEQCGGDFLRFAARLALATGMRRGELVRLTEKMINSRARTITLPPEITKSTKGRVVYLNDAALAVLKAWKLRGTRGELFPGTADMWSDRITQQGWPALCAAAKITDLHFHDLRHDFAVQLLKSGATLEQVRDALGHASVTQTEKYAHVMPDDVRRAVLRLQTS